MELRRRDLLGGAVAALVSACVREPSSPSPQADSSPVPHPPDPPRPRPLRVLVLGGTGFAGPPIVTTLKERGHTVTLFNRGKTHPGLFPDVETILGDRVTELDKLKGRDWDAVVDTWAPGPTLVRRAGELLRDHVGQYVFLSTISVYKLGREPLHEGSTLLELPPGTDLKAIKKIDASNYGALKAMAERAAEETMPGRTTCVRPGVIAGPGDPTDRVTHWPLRLALGGEMIAPGSPTGDRMQFIDVRDLGAWIVRTMEEKTMGTFNAVGPDDAFLGAVLRDMQRALGTQTKLTWIPRDWLDAHDAKEWEAFPVVVSPTSEESGFAWVDVSRAVAKGLRFRPPGDTAKDALAWYRAQPEERRAKERPGLTREREAELLRAWHAEPR